MSQKDLEQIRHSLAHLLAATVLEFFPDAKPTIGPAIENGFYYDFDFPSKKPGEESLKEIEKKMKKNLSLWKAFKGIGVETKDAKKIFSKNPYKLELIDELVKNKEKINLYYSGPKPEEFSKKNLGKIKDQSLDKGFVDLCRGGHTENPAKEIDSKSFKLTHIAGAYWRGNEKNKMLTRIYGIAFKTKKEFEKYLAFQEESKKRNHRKIGKELGLFSFSEMVGSGLPLWSPKGTTLRNELQNRLFEISRKYKMQLVTIPHIAKKKLYETSGHAEKFGDELIKVISHYDEFVMKPVNCPHHIEIYASQPRSYRDLPIRYMESTMQYRDEKPGEIGGLTRVRSITVDDGHIFCTPEQIKDEAKKIAKIIEEFYKSLGLFGSHWVSLSVRDPNNLDRYIGNSLDWEKAEKMLKEVSNELDLKAKRIEGEAAIYGPKLDYVFKDSLNREWQLATIQIDFAMPKRFDLKYTDKRGEKITPVMIHRAILGSYERFLAILIEHYAGAFPVWLSPVQVIIVPIGEKFRAYGEKIRKELEESNIRVEMNDTDETLGKRIRNAEMQKVPYILVVGEKEQKIKSVNIRERNKKKNKTMKLEDFKKSILKKIENKK